MLTTVLGAFWEWSKLLPFSTEPHKRTPAQLHTPRLAQPEMGLRTNGTLDGAWEEIRTPDLRITNALLYRLSYPGRIGTTPYHFANSGDSELKDDCNQRGQRIFSPDETSFSTPELE